MNTNYKIVWIDDEYQTLESVALSFEENDILYLPFDNAEEAIKYIGQYQNDIDALVVDGNFLLKKNDDNIDNTGKAFHKILEHLTKIQYRKEIPYFVLSGQINFTSGRVDVLKLNDVAKVYDKLKPEDLDQMCKDIIQSVESTGERQAINKHKEVLLLADDEYLGERIKEPLVRLCIDLNKDHFDGGVKDLFTPIRKIIEFLFQKLNHLEIIPDEVIQSQGWLTNCSKLLANNYFEFEFSGNVHPTITLLLKDLMGIIQDSSHSVGRLNAEVDDYCQKRPAAYLYKGSINHLFEILFYFRNFIDCNSDKSVNATFSRKKTVVINNIDAARIFEGKVKRHEGQSFAFFESGESGNFYIDHTLVRNHNLEDGMQIKVNTKPNERRPSELAVKEIVEILNG